MNTEQTSENIFTYGNSILTNSAALQNQSDIHNCISKEADQRILRRAINCAKNAFERVDVLAIDTDVLILVVVYLSHLKSSVSVLCGTGLGTASINYYDVSRIADELGKSVCKALPFFHAFARCDTGSGFYVFSKSKFWNCWMESPNKDLHTDVFQTLRSRSMVIQTEQVKVIETLVLDVYYPNSEGSSLESEREHHYIRLADSNIRQLPVSLRGLTEHIKCACYQAG